MTRSVTENIHCIYWTKSYECLVLTRTFADYAYMGGATSVPKGQGEKIMLKKIVHVHYQMHKRM